MRELIVAERQSKTLPNKKCLLIVTLQIIMQALPIADLKL
jgi:hypothetical protein